VNSYALVQRLLLPLLCLIAASQTAQATSSDNGTLTVGQASVACIPPLHGTVTDDGYNPALTIGAYSPTGLTGGDTVGSIVDFHGGGCFGTFSFLVVTGFSADPGSGWLSSITCNSVKNSQSSATYTYSSGEARWQWSTTFGLTNGTQVGCTIVHS
jgi:hypothetical protein